MAHRSHDEHHLIPHWLLRHLRTHQCPLSGRYLKPEELVETQRHVKIRITRKTHEAFHAIADGATVIDTYERADDMFDAAREGRWIYEIHVRSITPLEAWRALFGTHCDAKTAKRKLSSWVYYYLFRNSQNASKCERVYTPKQLLAEDAVLLKHLWDEHFAISPYKRHALRALLFTDEFKLLDVQDLIRAYEERLPFE